MWCSPAGLQCWGKSGLAGRLSLRVPPCPAAPPPQTKVPSAHAEARVGNRLLPSVSAAAGARMISGVQGRGGYWGCPAPCTSLGWFKRICLSLHDVKAGGKSLAACFERSLVPLKGVMVPLIIFLFQDHKETSETAGAERLPESPARQTGLLLPVHSSPHSLLCLLQQVDMQCGVSCLPGLRIEKFSLTVALLSTRGRVF